MSATPSQASGIGPLVIAHRGASADLPEHTLASKALAYGLGADFLEQDVVATRDDHLVVLHDIHLDRVTDVVEKFPQRARPDGRYYVRDFSLTELATLNALERMTPERDKTVFPDRFPYRKGAFSISTLGDELAMVASLNRTTGRRVGVYPEIKRPAWHQSEGVDLTALVLRELEKHGYSRRSDPVYLQCFAPAETRRLREDLGCELRLVQLIADNRWDESAADYDALRSPQGLSEVAEYADAVGVWLNHVYTLDDRGMPQPTRLIDDAHAEGLAVHAYTFRADDLPEGFDDFEAVLDWFVGSADVDGLFTDFTGATVGWRSRRYAPA